MVATRSAQRFDRLREIESLDPETEHEQIFRLVTMYEFPFDYWQSAALAFFRTFAIPSIAELLDHAGESVDHTQKRVDDTLLVLYEMSRLGLETPEGRVYLRRMNKMHRHYEISNDDNVYTMALYIVLPVHWIRQYGWRRLTAGEERAITNYSRRLATLMGIRDVPATLEEFEDFVLRYERQHFAVTDSSVRLAEAAMHLCADMLPGPFRRPAKPFMRRFSLALLDDGVLEAVGLPRPTRVERTVGMSLLRARGRLLRVMPPRADDRPHQLDLPTYPHGHTITDVGPQWLNGKTPTDAP